MGQYSEGAILYHAALAIEAGLLHGVCTHNVEGHVVSATLQKLTWAGHDFLDAARNESVWKSVKAKIAKVGGAWTFEVVKALLVEAVKRAAG